MIIHVYIYIYISVCILSFFFAGSKNLLLSLNKYSNNNSVIINAYIYLYILMFSPSCGPKFYEVFNFVFFFAGNKNFLVSFIQFCWTVCLYTNFGNLNIFSFLIVSSFNLSLFLDYQLKNIIYVCTYMFKLKINLFEIVK